MIHTLEIGTLVIPVQAAGEIQQTYDSAGGVSSGRFMSGAAYKQRLWRKLKTTISGQGWVPPGLAGLDYDSQLLLKCVASRAVQSTSNVIAVPSARRSDYAPTGFAVVSGRYISTAISLVGDTATLTTISGAQGYGVRYWPQLTVYAEFSEAATPGAASRSWQISAEEV